MKTKTLTGKEYDPIIIGSLYSIVGTISGMPEDELDELMASVDSLKVYEKREKSIVMLDPEEKTVGTIVLSSNGTMIQLYLGDDAENNRPADGESTDQDLITILNIVINRI
jgi:hypothetical protein